MSARDGFLPSAPTTRRRLSGRPEPSPAPGLSAGANEPAPRDEPESEPGLVEGSKGLSAETEPARASFRPPSVRAGLMDPATTTGRSGASRRSITVGGQGI